MSAVKDELLLFKNKVRGARSPLHLLLDVRNQVSPATYGEAIGWVRSYPNHQIAVFNPDFPTSARHINESPLLSSTSASRELRWAGAYLSAHGPKLTDFVRLSLDFQRALLLDNYNACREALDKVEKCFGYSLWLIRNRITLLQVSEGLEAQKKYTKTIQEEVKDVRGVVSYIVYAISTRCEPAVHPARFVAGELDRVASVSFSEDLTVYLNYHIDPHNSLNMAEIADILRWESASSILDYYEALLSALQFATSESHQELSSSVLSVTRSLQAKVRDPRLDALIFELTGKEPPPCPAQAAAVDALNSFLVGDLERTNEIALKALDLYPESPDLREIAARATALRSSETSRTEEPLNGKILSRMSAVVVKGDTISDDVDDLLKMALVFSGFPWSKALLGFLARELSPNPLEAGGGIVRYAASGTPSLSPIQFSAFPNPSTKALFADYAQRMFGRCPATVYGLASAGETPSQYLIEGWSQEEQVLLNVRNVLQQADFMAALVGAERLIQSDQPYYQQKGTGLKALCLLRLGRMEECISFITATYIHCPYLQIILPLLEVVDALDIGTRREVEKNVSLPLFYDMCCRFMNDSQSTERSYAYEDFLIANGLERPSQIVSILDRVDHDKAVYYLRYLCVEPIMDNSIAFQGTQDLRDEWTAPLK